MPDWIKEAVRRARDGDPLATALVLRVFLTGAPAGTVNQLVLDYLTDAIRMIIDYDADANDIFRPKRPGRPNQGDRDMQIATDVAFILRYLEASAGKRRRGIVAEAIWCAARMHKVADDVAKTAWDKFNRDAKALVEEYLKTPS